MILKCFSIYDSKIGTYAKPFFQQSTGEALRSWSDLANDNEALVSKHPGDFALMEIGEYDDSTGAFNNLAAPLNLGLASQYKRAAETQAPLFQMKGAQ